MRAAEETKDLIGFGGDGCHLDTDRHQSIAFVFEAKSSALSHSHSLFDAPRASGFAEANREDKLQTTRPKKTPARHSPAARVLFHSGSHIEADGVASGSSNSHQ